MNKLAFSIIFLLHACITSNIHIERIGKNFKKDKNICLVLDENDLNDLQKDKYYKFLLNELRHAGYTIDKTKKCEYFAGIVNDIKHTHAESHHSGSSSTHYGIAHYSGTTTTNNFYNKSILIDIFDKSGKKVFQGRSTFNDAATNLKYYVPILIKSIFFVNNRYGRNDFINYIKEKKYGKLSNKLSDHSNFDQDFLLDIDDILESI